MKNVTQDIVNFIYVSEMVGMPIVNGGNHKKIGTIVDLAATTTQIYPKITGLLVRQGSAKEPVYIPWSKVTRITQGKSVAADYGLNGANVAARASENEILLKKTFLDRQIISTSGNKVVRVNDLHLLIDNTEKEDSNLWLVHIDIGIKGLLRRLGWLPFVNAAFKWVMGRDIGDKFLSWKYVQPTEMTNVHGSFHLKVDSSKLAEMHPADLADVFEDLGADERFSLLKSLTPATAAATIQEIPTKLRVRLAERLDPEHLATIIDQMHMDEAVDLLDELAPERRDLVYAALPLDKATEIRDLWKLSLYRVGGIMNTDFVTARDTQTAGEVLEALRTEAKKTELIYYVYVVDPEDRLSGVVTLRHLLLSDPSGVMSNLMSEKVVSVRIDASIKRVAQIFFKYDFDAIPVVDDENRVRGIITMRDAMESVFPEMKEESTG